MFIKIRRHKKTHLIITLFLLALLIPLIFCENSKENAEKRPLQTFPVFFTNNEFNKNVLKEIENWINDQFGLRKEFIKLYSYFHARILNVSPSDQVVIGKNNWLFYVKKIEGDNLSDFQRINLPNDDRLNSIKDFLENEKKYLSKQNIPFYILIAPNKHNIYKEFFPEEIKSTDSKSKLDSFLSLTKKLNIPTINPTRALIKNKKKSILYYEAGSHWNEYGAYIAYADTVKKIADNFKNIKATDISQFRITKENTKIDGDSIAYLMGINSYPHSSIIQLTPTFPETFVISDYKTGKNNRENLISKNKNTKLPKLIIFGDSFTKNIIKFFANNFSTVIFIWDYNIERYSDLIEKEKPDIVLTLIVERNIDTIDILAK